MSKSVADFDCVLRPCTAFERFNKVKPYPLFLFPTDEWASVWGWHKRGVPIPQMRMWVKNRGADRLRQLEDFTRAYEHEQFNNIY